MPLGPHGKNRYIRALNWYLKRSCIIPNTKELAESLNLRCFFLPNPPGKVISNDEFEEIVQFSPDSTHELAFRLIFDSAFRPHELLSLRACDIGEKIINEEFLEIMINGEDNINSVVIVRIPPKNPVTPSGRNKTGKRSVIVSKNADELIELAEIRRIKSGPDSLLFPFPHKHFSVVFSRMKKLHSEIFTEISSEAEENPEGEPVNENKCQIDAKKLNVPNKTHDAGPLFHGRLYDLRHSAITRMYTLGINEQVIRSIVGWRSASKMPDTYVHIGEQHILNDLFSVSASSRFKRNDICNNIDSQKSMTMKKTAGVQSKDAFSINFRSISMS